MATGPQAGPQKQGGGEDDPYRPQRQLFQQHLETAEKELFKFLLVFDNGKAVSKRGTPERSSPKNPKRYSGREFAKEREGLHSRGSSQSIGFQSGQRALFPSE